MSQCAIRRPGSVTSSRMFGSSLFASTPTDAARWLATNFALCKPTLLLVDDLHWADEPLLRWPSE
jgi:hypothetical protein